MKKFILLMCTALLLCLISCEQPVEEMYPCLEVVNEYRYDVVTKVSLVGYTFDSLDIKYGESQKILFN